MSSGPRFANAPRDHSNYDEMAELNLGLESAARAASTLRHVFPDSWRMFKPGSSSIGQQRRREEQLERYKDQKYQKVIKSRQMMDAFRAARTSPVETGAMSAHDDNMEVSEPKRDSQASSETVDAHGESMDARYGKALMLPEYLSEVPPDFDKEWFCVPFPDGTRCTLIAREGVTQARELDGTLIDEFQSQLPFGSAFHYSTSLNDCTILDCIQVEAGAVGLANSDVTVVYFVLDLMAWAGHFYYNSNAESRAWMKHHWIQEREGLNTISKDNRPTRNDRLILDLSTYETTSEGLTHACTSPALLTINIDPKYHPIYRGQPSNEDETFDDILNEEEYDDHPHHRPPIPSTYLHERHIEFRVEGVMFYFKDMDYVNEQTPVMCLLPLRYAQDLLADHESRSSGGLDILEATSEHPSDMS